METQAVTVNLPEPLYDRLVRRAERSQRTVEVELAEAVAALPEEVGDLPIDLAEAIAALHLLSEQDEQ
jgi:hypothetical protein